MYKMEHNLNLAFLILWMSELVSGRSLDHQNVLLQSDTHGLFGLLKNSVRSKIPTVPSGCGGKPADVYFVMDTSRDVSQKDIDTQKQYLKAIAPLFYLGLDTVRLGIISTGSTTVTAVRLGTHADTKAFQEAVDLTPRIGGQRDTAQTLDFLRRQAFAPSAARHHVAHVVIYLTNGFSPNSKLTLVEARLLKKMGVYVYMVNQGQADKSELAAVASTPSAEFVFDSSDFHIVDPLIKQLRIHECAYQIHPSLAEPKPACSPRREVDIVFAIDHLHLGSVKAKRLVSFVNNILVDFDNNGNLQTGILFSRPASIGRLSGKLFPLENTEDELDKVAFPDFGSLLRRTRRTLIKGRELVQKTAVIFIDSSVPLSMVAFKEAKRNKFKKIETYVVYIGDDYDKDDLALVSNGMGRDNIIIVSSYEELDVSREDVVSRICRGL